LAEQGHFTGIFRGDAYEMMPQQVVTDSSGNSYLQVAGVRIGFAQVGVTFDPEEVLSRARLGSFKVDRGHVQFLVILFHFM
jgi:hypothetical protein